MRFLIQIFMVMTLLWMVLQGGAELVAQAPQVLAQGLVIVLALATAGFVLLAAPENLLKQGFYQLTGPAGESRLLLRDTTVRGVRGNDLLFAAIFMIALLVPGLRVLQAVTGQAATDTEMAVPGMAELMHPATLTPLIELWVTCLVFAAFALYRHRHGRDRLAGEVNQANWYPVYLAVTPPVFLALGQLWAWLQPLFAQSTVQMLQNGPAHAGVLLVGLAAANEAGRRLATTAFAAGAAQHDGSVILPQPRPDIHQPSTPVEAPQPRAEPKPKPAPEPKPEPRPEPRPERPSPAPRPVSAPSGSVVVPTPQRVPAPAPATAQSIVFKPLSSAQTVIRGQDRAIREIEQTLKLACAGLSNRDGKPLASFLFLGPTGVGKTEAAKAIAEVLYGDRNRIARFNMNEASGEGGQWRAFGPPPGYMGSDKGGQLTRQILQYEGRCVVLLDEMEKGPREVFDALLTGLDEGYVEDASLNQRISIQDAVVIMTSNILADEATVADEEELRTRVRDAEVADGRLGRIRPFRPEFVGRIKTVVQFEALGREHMQQILVDRYRRHFAPRIMQAMGVAVPDLTPGAVSYLMAGLGEASFGARQLDREIEKRLMLGLVEIDRARIPDPAVWHYDEKAQQLMLLAIEQAAVLLGGAEQAERERHYAELQRQAEALRRQGTPGTGG